MTPPSASSNSNQPLSGSLAATSADRQTDVATNVVSTNITTKKTASPKIDESRFAIQVWRIALAAAVGTAAVLPGLLTIRESLWIDELHTGWVAVGSWSEMLSRSQQGNQSPLAMAIFKLAYARPSDHAWWLRLPSVLAWFAAFFLAALHLFRWKGSLGCEGKGSSASEVTVAAVGSLALLLDANSWFYSIEARPYALVVLGTASLLLMPTSSKFQWRWVLIATLTIAMHYSALLVVVAHALGRRWVTPVKWMRELELGLSGIACIPLLQFAIPIAERRKQWNEFAGDGDWIHAILQLPFLPWLAWPLVALAMIRLYSRRRVSSKAKSEDREPSQSKIQETTRQVVPIALVAILPCAMAWSCTVLGLAPLMHRRYFIGSHLACWLFFAMLLKLLSVRSQRLSIGLLGCGLLVLQQGNWALWRQGEWTGWQRNEDWRGIVEYINEHAQPEDEIALAPMLIETSQDDVEPTNEYLAFALRSNYPCNPKLPIHILPNQPARWMSRLAKISPSHRVWLIARMPSRSLQENFSRANISQLGPMNGFPETGFNVENELDFGNVSLLRRDAFESEPSGRFSE